MDDQDIARDIKHWPFEVREKGGKPVISVSHKGEKRDFVSRIPTFSWHILTRQCSDPRGNFCDGSHQDEGDC